MCGFVAVVDCGSESVNIGELLDTIKHRGPDDRGWLAYENGKTRRGHEAAAIRGEVLLGHVRLSIIDLTEAGWQPMSSASGKHHLVFNGEIYNYLELRTELEAAGHTFRTHSDTEVLLMAIVAWGAGALNRLRGMFAFCFFNEETRELLLARDFFGIKPLFYCKTKSGLAFASEQQPLLKLPGVSRKVAGQALYDFLTVGATDQGARTLLEDIKQVPAAHFISIKIDGSARDVTPVQYWRIDLRKRRADAFPTAINRVRELFLESVSLHLRSDVPVGAALSGGIDSSAIVCAIRHLRPKQEIHTFSYIADDASISEERWVDIVNQHSGAIPHKVRATKEEMVDDLEDLIHAQGEPFGSTSIYAQYRVFKAAAQAGIKVMLDGQGADEMLGGYVFYQGSRLASLLRSRKFHAALSFFLASSRWPGRSKKQLAMYTAREMFPRWAIPIARRIASKGVPPRWVSTKWIASERIQTRASTADNHRGQDSLRAHLLQTLEQTSIPHLLRYEDRNSMRFSIESRVPFLHVELAEYFLSLPEEFLLASDGTSKHVFREAMRGIVPDEVLDRKDKIGFATPERAWLTRMDQWVNSRLADAHAAKCFDTQELSRDWQQVVSGDAAFDFRCWRWLNVIEWHASLGKTGGD